MSTLGLTGTRDVLPFDALRLLVARRRSLIDRHEMFVTGACRGWDASAGRLLVDWYPERRHVVYVPANREQVDVWWKDSILLEKVESYGGELIIIDMPLGSSYKDRNQWIVDVSSELLACAEYPESHGRSTRSGTWQTVRMARRAGLPVTVDILNGAT